MRNLLALVLLLILVVAGWIVYKQRNPSAASRAEAEARAAGDQATSALQRAGREVERGARDLERRAQPALEDAALTAKVKAKLAADPEVAAYTIDVDTLEHVVTLSGRVGSAEEAAEAEKLARNTTGVQAVVNRLAVGDGPIPGTVPAPAAVPSPAR
jgi:osmotically-inducible protein OsmY